MKEIIYSNLDEVKKKTTDIINHDLARFKAVRARGPGGQRTNRRSTKIQAWVKIEDLPLSDFQKKLVREKLINRINEKDELEVEEEEEASQFLNKKRALERLNELVSQATKIKPPRIPTEPPKSVEEKRIREKKIKTQKKKSRSLKHQLAYQSEEDSEINGGRSLAG